MDEKNEIISIDESNKVQEIYNEQLQLDPKYSLEVDPENKYNMTDEEKAFVKYYVDFKNVNTVAHLMKIKNDRANELFLTYSIRNEIRRINLALYHRQFSARLLSLDEIGGYLTSLLCGINTPLADQPTCLDDKLEIIKLLLTINKAKKDSVNDPSKIMDKDLESQLKSLSITTIKQMLIVSEDQKDKNKIINEINSNLSPEESAYLSTLPTEDLLQIIDESYKEKKE